jgi:hypothetical protein
MITRRRCLLAVARVLNVESQTYRLMLLEGMERDAALLALPRTAKGRHARIRAALERYSAGNEQGALEALAKGQPRLKPFAERPVEESFLVALLAAL